MSEIKQEYVNLNKITKAKLQTLLMCEEFCCICMKVEELHILKECLMFNELENKVINFEEALKNVFLTKASTIMFSKYICLQCKDNVINSFLFINNVIKNAEVFHLYLDDLSCRIENIFYEIETKGDINNVLFTLENPINCLASVQNKYEKKQKAINKSKVHNSIKHKTDDSSILSTVSGHFIKPLSTGSSIKGVMKSLKRKHVKKEKEVYTAACTYCHYTCRSKRGLIIHITNKHKGMYIKKYSQFLCRCYVCHETFETKKQLNQHLSSHAKGSLQSCEICFKTFNSRHKCSHHRRQHLVQNSLVVVSGKQNKYKCSECEYKAQSKDLIEGHRNRYHLKIMPYACEVCERTFTSRLKMLTHHRRHAGERNYMCSDCGDKFTTKTGMIKHMRLHTGERPYKCDECEEAFISASHRLTHKKKAHVGKTVACPLCNMMFYSLINTRMHIKKVHWKREDAFDWTKLEGLTEKDFDIFKDHRMIYLEE